MFSPILVVAVQVNLEMRKKMCNFAPKLGIKMCGLVLKLDIKTCGLIRK